MLEKEQPEFLRESRRKEKKNGEKPCCRFLALVWVDAVRSSFSLSLIFWLFPLRSARIGLGPPWVLIEFCLGRKFRVSWYFLMGWSNGVFLLGFRF
jgi:hypothetical protein